MVGCPHQSVLEAFLLGRLSEPESHFVESHSRDCPTCLAALDKLAERPLPRWVQLDSVRRAKSASQPSATFDRLLDVMIRLDCGTSVTELNRAPANRSTDRGGPAVSVASDSPPPTWPCIPGYQVEGVLGHGGMGIVYRVRQWSTDTSVALKMILPDGAASNRRLDAFRKEADHLRRLHHPNVVQVYEIGHTDGVPFVTMHLEAGGNLSQIIADGPISAERVAQLMEGMAEGIEYAHRQGILHLDLKPANVILDRDGVPKVSDFGLARRRSDLTDFPYHGSVCGTPAYMAPEQAANQISEFSPRTDVYGLGAVMYQLLTRAAPFEGKTGRQILDRVRLNPPIPPRERAPGVDERLEAICLKCLAKKPSERYGSVQEFLDEIHRWQGREVSAEVRSSSADGRNDSGRKGMRRGTSFVLMVFAVVAAVIVCLDLTLSPALPDVNISSEPPPGSAKDPRTTLIDSNGKPSRPFNWRPWENNQKIEHDDPRITLIDSNGKPSRPFDWRPSENKRGIECAGGEFSIAHAGCGLLELVPETQMRGGSYRFGADIFHAWNMGGETEVGLYFGHQEVDFGGPGHAYGVVSFAERWGENGPPPDKLRASVQFHRLDPHAPKGYICCRRPFGSQLFAAKPAPAAGPSVWHRLEVEVRPTRIDIFWDKKKTMTPRLLDFEGVGQEANVPADQRPPFSPHGGLGLYVREAKASFRSVTLERIEEPN